MSVMAGPDPRDPGCLPSDPGVFLGALERDFRGMRVAWCPDLGGLPLDPRVRTVLAAQRQTFEALGCIVEDAVPDLRDAESVFLTHARVSSGRRPTGRSSPSIATRSSRKRSPRSRRGWR